MRKLILSEFLSLDGVMEAPEKWQFPYQSPDAAEETKQQILASDVLLLGRVTYETFASFWPTQIKNEFGIADKLNNQPKFVVSSTLKKAEWNNSTIIKGNVIEEIAKLKQQPGGDIALTGSAALAQSLMRAGLIDEFQFQVYPLILGSGKRLFDGIDTTTLKLVDTKTFSLGAVQLNYQLDKKDNNSLKR
jgi:dihydrofolate reductase